VVVEFNREIKKKPKRKGKRGRWEEKAAGLKLRVWLERKDLEVEFSVRKNECQVAKGGGDEATTFVECQTQKGGKKCTYRKYNSHTEKRGNNTLPNE